jgi:hypothetical protein
MGLGLLKKVEERVNRVEEIRKQQHKEHQYAVLSGEAKPTATERMRESVKRHIPQPTQERLEHAKESIGSGWNLFRTEAPITTREMGGLFLAEGKHVSGLVDQFNLGIAGSHSKTKKGKTKYLPGSLEKTSDLFFAQPPQLNLRPRKPHERSIWEL